MRLSAKAIDYTARVYRGGGKLFDARKVAEAAVVECPSVQNIFVRTHNKISRLFLRELEKSFNSADDDIITALNAIDIHLINSSAPKSSSRI